MTTFAQDAYLSDDRRAFLFPPVISHTNEWTIKVVMERKGRALILDDRRVLRQSAPLPSLLAPSKISIHKVFKSLNQQLFAPGRTSGAPMKRTF